MVSREEILTRVLPFAELREHVALTQVRSPSWAELKMSSSTFFQLPPHSSPKSVPRSADCFISGRFKHRSFRLFWVSTPLKIVTSRQDRSYGYFYPAVRPEGRQPNVFEKLILLGEAARAAGHFDDDPLVGRFSISARAKGRTCGSSVTIFFSLRESAGFPSPTKVGSFPFLIARAFLIPRVFFPTTARWMAAQVSGPG